MKNISIAIIIFVLLSKPVFGSEYRYLGYTGYVIGSSKVLGMGGAFTGISDDVNSVLYNPAGIVFSEAENIVSFSLATFTDKSIDLDKNSSDEVWKSDMYNFGFIHRTKRKNKFTWGIYVTSNYKIIFTNDTSKKDKFILPLGAPGEEYEFEFDLGGFLVPLIWQVKENLSVGITPKICISSLKAYEKIGAYENKLKQDATIVNFDLSTMYIINDRFSLGLFYQPPAHFKFNENANSSLQNFKWFYDVYVPMQINTGLGYKFNKRIFLDFDLHYTKFKGNESLVGSNLAENLNNYKMARKYLLTPHIGTEYKTIFLKKELDVRAGYYYQPNIFSGIPPKDHLTFSFAWRIFKLPKNILLNYLTLGYSSDIAKNYDVQTINIDSEF